MSDDFPAKIHSPGHQVASWLSGAFGHGSRESTRLKNYKLTDAGLQADVECDAIDLKILASTRRTGFWCEIGIVSGRGIERALASAARRGQWDCAREARGSKNQSELQTYI